MVDQVDSMTFLVTDSSGAKIPSPFPSTHGLEKSYPISDIILLTSVLKFWNSGFRLTVRAPHLGRNKRPDVLIKVTAPCDNNVLSGILCATMFTVYLLALLLARGFGTSLTLYLPTSGFG